MSSQPHLSSWPNPHSTRGTAAAHIQRFRALALFGRRPLERVDRPAIPASENLHRSGHSGFDLAADDVMGHRKAEPSSFSGWLGGEEGIEHLFSHVRRDAGAVVANADFDHLTEISGGRAEHRLEVPVAVSPLRLVAA